MNNLINLLKYILLNYPDINQLSKPRLVKIIYLIDWRYAIENGVQYTSINWFFNHYGPYVSDVINVMYENSETFRVTSFPNPYFGTTHKFELLDKSDVILDYKIRKVTDFVITKTFDLSWSDFIDMVYSSFPIKNSSKYSNLNLQELAINYKSSKTKT